MAFMGNFFFFSADLELMTVQVSEFSAAGSGLCCLPCARLTCKSEPVSQEWMYFYPCCRYCKEKVQKNHVSFPYILLSAFKNVD